MRRIFQILLPGVGLIGLGRTGRGVLHFFLFALLLNLFLMLPFLMGDSAPRVAALAGAAAVWIWSAVDTLRTKPEPEESGTEERQSRKAYERS